VTLYQEHGAVARTVSSPIARDALPKADAVISTTPGLVIGVLTADCTPVLLADAEARVVAAAHAGWRGAVSGVVESAILEMERQGADRRRICAAIGPTISQTAYEVGPDFETDVLNRDPSAEAFFAIPYGAARAHFDLPGYVMARLTKFGIANAENLHLCTHAGESRFFSFRRTTQRREPDYGRQISAIVVT
jgi:YfiH family protein